MGVVDRLVVNGRWENWLPIAMHRGLRLRIARRFASCIGVAITVAVALCCLLFDIRPERSSSHPTRGRNKSDTEFESSWSAGRANTRTKPPGTGRTAGRGPRCGHTRRSRTGPRQVGFKTDVQEVVLHATVADEAGRLVTSLDRSAFLVFQNGVPEPITSFRREDVPVAMGIVIDNSGSMRDKRDKVNQAVLNLILASNPQDQIFVVNFSQKS